MPNGVSPSFYAIVVDVPKPELNCFIAFPFSLNAPSAEYPLTEVINKAIQKEGLTPCWVDWAAPGTNIIENVTREILGATMVIAVCSPEGSTGKANPNVMYELGRAEALGKPILMMTTDPSALPFDIRGTNAFTYSTEELADRKSRDALQARLEVAMSRLKAKTMQEPALILRDLKDIWVVRAANRIVLTQDFWDYAKAVFAFADGLGVEGHALTGELTRIFDMATRRCDVEPLFGEFMYTWNQYDRGHNMRIVPYLGPPRQALVEKALKNLVTRGETFGAQEMLSILQSDYDQLGTHVKEYEDAFRSTKESVNSLIRTSEKPKDLLYQVSQLEQKLQNLTNSADNVVRNLIRTMNRWFYTLYGAPDAKGAGAKGAAA